MSASSDANDGRPVVAMHWFRKGLRLHDNPALLRSLSLANGCDDSSGGGGGGRGRIYPTYVVDPNSYQLLRCSVNRATFLLECVKDLDAGLRARGSRLHVVAGDPTEELPKLWKRWGVTHLVHEADETGEPHAAERDEAVRAAATEAGIEVEKVVTETLRPLGNATGGYVANVGGDAERVPGTMSSFQSLISRIDGGKVPKPLEAPEKADFPPRSNDDEDEEDEHLPLEHPWDIPWPRGCDRDEIGPVWNRKDCRDETLRPVAKGGETRALERLRKTVTARPDWTASFEKPKTSCTEVSDPSTTAMGPYLSVGCLSPRTAWHAVSEANGRASAGTHRSKPPVSLHGQLLWRDFNNLMAHAANARAPGSWGKMENNPYCREVPWSSDPRLLTAWKEGRTGYPWIDANMSQLKAEGWIHHLGRHAVACFLTRGDLWQSWEAGAEHFEGELLDADYALNNFNWMWLSCSGFFYQYFRCYSPVVFQKKNDPNGEYVKKWVPELASLPAKYIYEPWKAPVGVLKAAGVKLGVTYPRPIVDHAVVSKENMSKMSLAYDMHKDKVAGEKKKKSPAGGKAERGPVKKKAKRQTKLK